MPIILLEEKSIIEGHWSKYEVLIIQRNFNEIELTLVEILKLSKIWHLKWRLGGLESQTQIQSIEMICRGGWKIEKARKFLDSANVVLLTKQLRSWKQTSPTGHILSRPGLRNYPVSGSEFLTFFCTEIDKLRTKLSLSFISWFNFTETAYTLHWQLWMVFLCWLCCGLSGEESIWKNMKVNLNILI